MVRRVLLARQELKVLKDLRVRMACLAWLDLKGFRD
jgi:hypothetical protein